MSEQQSQTSQSPISLRDEREVIDLVGHSIMNLWGDVVNDLRVS